MTPDDVATIEDQDNQIAGLEAALVMSLRERDRLRGAVAALFAALGTWDSIWMDWQKGRITDEEYVALQRLGALVGMADPHPPAGREGGA